ncbi:class I SAM-dependent methyltransferase [Lachnospiraceae bacterium]|nr:class I SAM-dependent methyltransferase [Lachnospiraceae bacterium]
MEKIGNVVLDDTHYPGEDLYSDGAVEDHILELVRTYPQEEYPRVIAREENWAVMYHLAYERENILSWYPFTPGAKVLEVGSGCGAVTGAIAKAAGEVTCIDLSKKRSMINAVRHKDSGNIKICLGNFQDVERDLEKDFDYATLIGVFEYGRGYIGGEKPYHDFLATVMKHVRPGGKLLLAIENKFGLKYWAGCREDHAGTYFEGLEGYPAAESVRTFTRTELIRIMEECGYTDYKFYYPYPDYKLPRVIYSDAYLPRLGELNQNICNFDRDRLVLMDEGRVYDQIIKDGLFPLYANSFFVEIRKPDAEKEADTAALGQNMPVYTKYSSGRAAEFSIQTRMVMDLAGNNIMYKKAEHHEGQKHISHMAEAARRLKSLWQEKGLLSVNACVLKGDRAEFEYLEGITLEEELDGLLEQNRLKEAADRLREGIIRIRDSAPVTVFEMTPEFQRVFGAIAVTEEEQAVPVADVDLIFSNLLRTKDQRWHVLDYEWTFFFPVPVAFILYRALHYYLEGAPARRRLKETFDFYEEFHISSKQREIYRQMERQFQKYITGNSVSPYSLYHTMGKKALPIGDLLAETNRRRVQVYLDYGQGFTEEQSYFIETGCEEHLDYSVTIPDQATAAWIDPALSACILKDVRLSWQGENTPVKYDTTGFELEKNCYLFDNSDPKIIIEEMPPKNRRVEVSYDISILEEETAALLMDKMNTRKRVKKKIRKLVKG